MLIYSHVRIVSRPRWPQRLYATPPYLIYQHPAARTRNRGQHAAPPLGSTINIKKELIIVPLIGTIFVSRNTLLSDFGASALNLDELGWSKQILMDDQNRCYWEQNGYESRNKPFFVGILLYSTTWYVHSTSWNIKWNRIKTVFVNAAYNLS